MLVPRSRRSYSKLSRHGANAATWRAAHGPHRSDPNTRFERIDGLSGLKAGAKNIEATVKRRNGVWVALEVERSGGGGEHGDDD